MSSRLWWGKRHGGAQFDLVVDDENGLHAPKCWPPASQRKAVSLIRTGGVKRSRNK
jgi:hypothetical protein